MQYAVRPGRGQEIGLQHRVNLYLGRSILHLVHLHLTPTHPSIPLCLVSHQYRDGFQVDDGPYRRLNDPANADFLRSLAMGRTPRELMEEGDG